jgi:hypothetical protein
MSLRKSFRLALIGTVGLVGLCHWAPPALAAAPPEKTLPNTTFLFVKANNAANLREAIKQSQMGQLWADPAMQPLKDDLAAKIDDASKKVKEAVGVSLLELLQLPQGPVSFAILAAKEGAKVPVAALLSADAGNKADTMKEVMTKATKLAEDDDTKVTTEDFMGKTLHVIQSTKPEDKDDPPVVWTSQGSIYHVSTDLDALKDLLSHADGRDDSLADSDSFQQVSKKVGDDGQFVWYLDVTQGIKLVVRAAANAGGKNGGNAQQVEAMLQVTGINGLKAMGGTVAFNAGHYDMLNKTFILAPGPSQGVLKIFAMPPTSLRPEPWVPATAATYESFSWDLDSAYKAIEDLTNMIQPGLLQALQQQLAGPNGGELDFQKDLFGPIGDRVTIITDFKKKPKNKTGDTTRTLVAVALEDSKAFRNTLNKLFAMAKISPKKRDFQGTTIYDIDPEDLGAAGAGNVTLTGPICVCVAKDTCFLATEPTLLELVLRGGPRLADSAEFQAVAREVPEQTSTLSYAKSEEAVRQIYDMVKGGQLQEAIKQAAANKGNGDAPNLDNLIDKSKLPEFSTISKYVSQTGGYGVMTEDGFFRVSFSLRKGNP